MRSIDDLWPMGASGKGWHPIGVGPPGSRWMTLSPLYNPPVGLHHQACPIWAGPRLDQLKPQLYNRPQPGIKAWSNGSRKRLIRMLCIY